MPLVLNSMMQRILILVLIGSLLTSCIPKKDLVYFQGEPSKNTKAVIDEPYKLQVNDIIDIRIKADDDKLVGMFSKKEGNAQVANQFNQENLYFTSYSIDRHGNIRMPYLGEINVLGYTEDEVRQKIETELKKYFKDTTGIFVTTKLAGIRFTVLGEVSNTGTIVMYQNQVSIVDAIANAGDILVTGNRKKVIIIRKNNEGTKKYSIDLTDASSFNSTSFYIQSNDIIYIEPLKQKSWGTGTTGLQTLTTLLSIASLVTSAILISRNL